MCRGVTLLVSLFACIRVYLYAWYLHLYLYSDVHICARVTTRFLLQELRAEVSAVRMERSEAVRACEEAWARCSRSEAEAGERRSVAERALQDLAEARQETVRVGLRADQLDDEVSSC